MAKGHVELGILLISLGIAACMTFLFVKQLVSSDTPQVDTKNISPNVTQNDSDSDVAKKKRSTAQKGIAAGGGIQYLPTNERKMYFSQLRDIGAEWIRFDFAWSDIQSAGENKYAWTKYDQVVKDARASNIRVLGMLGYTPEWARPSDCIDTDKCAPEDSATYARFVEKSVRRYKKLGVKNWEVWNEPNNSVFWKPKPDATSYATLLGAAYAAIKKVDPSAHVISGGLSPATNDGDNIAPVDYLESIYASSSGTVFDSVGFHPYCYYNDFDCPNEFATWSAWSQMDETNSSIRSVMKQHGDRAKKIWATEFGAPTNGQNAVAESHQADIVESAYRLFGQEEWAGPLFWYSLQDNGSDASDVEDWFGLRDSEGRQKPAYMIYKAIPNV